MAFTGINKSTNYFNTKLYTGTGAELAISGIGFQPDLIWLKKRALSGHHFLQDAVRGATYQLKSSTLDQQANYSQYVKSIQSDGFTMGTDSDVNPNGGTGVAWNWKANGQGSSNTDGSINTTYTSANTTAGFSIIKWTGNGSAGATIGHGLGVIPKAILIKRLDGADQSWICKFPTATDGYLALNNGDAVSNSSNWLGVSNSLITLSNSWSTYNNSGDTYIAYCFADKTGYQKIGSYKGNSSADGTFVYTGFKPSWILIKNSTDSSNNWHIYDNKRLGYNVDNNMLRANLTNAEQTDDDIDLLSNGFKLRRSTGALNTGHTYVYLAIGQSLVGSNNVPCTAR